MPINPPKCKTCGVAEWRHTCGPRVKPKTILKDKRKPKTKAKK